MVNLITGFGIVLNYYFLTGTIVATALLISAVTMVMFDDENLDFEDHIMLGFYLCIGYILVVLCWIVIPIFAPFILCCIFAYFGRRVFFVNVGMYGRRRRNFIKDNFLYRNFVDKDKRKGEDVF